MSGNKRLLLVLLLGLSSWSTARADSGAAARTREFREQYDRASLAYNAHDYATAIPALQAAFAIEAVPQLLFNIAQAYRKLELYAPARVYLELYRAMGKIPTPELVDLTDRLIVELDELERAKATPKVIEVEKTKLLYVQSEKPLPRWLRPLGITSGVAGLGLLAVGTTFLALDGSCRSPAEPPALQCAQLYNTGTPGTALTAVGAGVLALGIVTFGLSFKKPPKPTIQQEPQGVPPAEPPADTLPTLPALQDMLSGDHEPPPTGFKPSGKPATR